jgi:DNA-directed RNA polymerase omega subunit
MINSPPTGSQWDSDSKYSLVVAVAKRARQIVNRRDPGVVFPHKPVIMALEEIADGTVRVFIRPEAPKVESVTEESAVISEVPTPEAAKPEEEPQK